MKCAIVCGKLGAGRTKAGEAINFGVGITLTAHIGSQVEIGTTHFCLVHNTMSYQQYLHVNNLRATIETIRYFLGMTGEL